ncbi:PTS mannose transporter subunit IIA [Rothia nasimurium]|uniref:Mannitol-specific phosphotransferase enzyme IIA component n=1 Tax=Rothia nasimurium TaxID=85336 RepID=A0A1Y1RRY6_9MICC|nr:PTS mannitol transporter subunit IICBA [Rothia nasimurium]ORC24429.1 PTS mannose transporter subunit IIA [Rothia nasimurium]
MAETQSPSLRVRVQKFGTFLSSMIMPNIGALIAWGIITALFIPDGLVPKYIPALTDFSALVATMVGPMVTYLLPILIAYTGGKIVYDHRGGVVGATATMGVIMGTSDPLFIGELSGSPMFLGAMVMGPLAAWCMKKLDGLWDGKIKPGFEMLVNNFSAGIFAVVAALGSMFLLTPVMRAFSGAAEAAVNWLVSTGFLPLTALLIEPAKVLFLNNAINHGIITPLGTAQALEQGKSILFLLEANPGPGLGILLAYCFFGRGSAKATAPGAALIHFVGGIHEIYFPYVLMKPQLVLAAIAGGMAGTFTFLTLNVGLTSAAAPGSILAISAVAAPGDHLKIYAGVLAATLVSFVVAAPILRFSKKGESDLESAAAKMQEMKGKKSSVAGAFATGHKNQEIRSIVFACDAGMGSSAMGASVLRNKIKDAGFGDRVTVVNSAISNLKDEYDLLVSHQDLADRAATPTPSAVHIAVDNFMSSPRYDEIVEMIREQQASSSATEAAPATTQTPVPVPAATAVATEEQVLTASTIRLGARAADRADAIDQAGALLVATGKVDESYVAAMHEREASVSTYMGNGLAIPHGTNEAKDAIHSSTMSLVRLSEPVEWNGKPVTFVIGIAGAGGTHLELLQKVAKIFSNKQKVAELEAATTEQEILDIFGKEQS